MKNLFIDIIELTLPVSVWIGLLLLCSPLLKRSYVAKWRYYMWMFVAARLIIPLRPHTAAPITMELPQAVGAIGTERAAEGGGASLMVLLVWVWILGMLVFALHQAVRYLSFKRLSERWSQRMRDEAVLAAFERARNEAGIRRRLEIRTCKAVATPMIFGIFRPTLLMPDMEFSEEDLPAVLCHELVHFKRHDILYKLLLLFAAMMHWFNPMVYLMLRAANRDIELACDAEVVRSRDGAFRRHYCETILKIVHNGRQRSCALSTCFLFSKKTVMERFKNILDEKLKRNGILLFGVIAVSVAVSGGAVGFATERVAEELEDNLQLVERRTPEPEPAAETEIPTEFVPAAAVVNTPADNETAYVKTETVPKQNVPEPVYTVPSPKQSAAVSEVSIGAQKQEIYDVIGEPDTVSGDGAKETYQLDDGTTAVLRYDDNGILDEGYIVIGGNEDPAPENPPAEEILWEESAPEESVQEESGELVWNEEIQ